MIPGKFNIVLDQAFGSSGKGKISTWLAGNYPVHHVSCSNMPNAGHTAVIGSRKFVAKVLPTPAILHKLGVEITCWLSPGCAFHLDRLNQELDQTNHPELIIHERAILMNPSHAQRERSGNDSTARIASTMQGCGIALSEKIMRSRATLACELPFSFMVHEALTFRTDVQGYVKSDCWLHECSQGYELSIDHGLEYPYTTSRNCTTQAALDQMGVPPSMLGDVYLNLRTFPIRVGNIEGGYSGPFHPDSDETSWEEIGMRAGMPSEEIERLKAREHTTVTKRLRRVATFSFESLIDAARTNDATKLCVNFIQYINWEDRGKRDYQCLSRESRAFIEKCEDAANLPVALIGTGADHYDIIQRL